MSTNQLVSKWAKIIDLDKDSSKGHLYEAITNTHRRRVTAQLLENQLGSKSQEVLSETPTTVTSNVDKFDPILIKLVRRMVPKLIAYDICGVQAMSGPTGQIFAMRSRYINKNGPEAFVNEADSAFGGAGSQVGTDPFDPAYATGTGMPTATAEGDAWNEMSLSIEKTAVSADSYQLKATYSEELSQDLKFVHGLDAEQELVDILSSELIAEMNRRVVRTIYSVAKLGAEFATTPGIIDMATDTGGRHMQENFKGLMFAIERDSNKIARETGRGSRGNIIICSADVASALALAGVLDNNMSISANVDLDQVGATYVGTYKGTYKVYVDPYVTTDFYLVGYKGSSPYDAGVFYCPYIPLQALRATDAKTFQPAIGFKTRAGIVANPYTTLSAGQNVYYRKVKVTNLL
jgi:hypothetical protein